MTDKLNGCFFLIEDDGWLEKYNTFWNKVTADLKKEFDSEPVYNKDFLKTNKQIKCNSWRWSYRFLWLKNS